MTYNKVIVFIDKTCVQALWPFRHTFLSKVVVKPVVHRIKWPHAEIKIRIQERTKDTVLCILVSDIGDAIDSGCVVLIALLQCSV